jgi:hypothetical protein
MNGRRREILSTPRRCELIARNECLGVAFLHGGFSAYEFKGCCMVQTWSGWKRFPDAQSGDHVEAPIGPGVYEVRHTLTGRVIAFGHAANVAHALSDLKLNGGVGTFARLFRKQPLVSRVSDLEYRTCAAATRAEAKTTASRLLGLRQTAWRRRMDLGWAARHVD